MKSSKKRKKNDRNKIYKKRQYMLFYSGIIYIYIKFNSDFIKWKRLERCYAKWQTHLVLPLLVITQISRLIPTKVTGVAHQPGSGKKKDDDDE